MRLSLMKLMGMWSSITNLKRSHVYYPYMTLFFVDVDK